MMSAVPKFPNARRYELTSGKDTQCGGPCD